MRYHYSAPWSRTLKVLSYGSLFLIVVLIAVNLSALPPHINIPVSFALLATIVFSLPFMVRGYRLDGHTLYIARLFGETAIDLRGLTDVSTDKDLLKGTIRTCGNGGLFSFTGWYWSKPLGAYRMFVSDASRPVILKFGHRKPIVISPGDPGTFAATARRLLS